MRILVGTTRRAKLEAVRAAAARIAAVAPAWRDAEVFGLAVTTNAPAMPLSDAELIDGARARAIAARELLARQGPKADYYVGLEGGFHTLSVGGGERTFLRGWVCAIDDEQMRESYGSTGSIVVPAALAREVTSSGRELGELIDEVAREGDVRSRQGAWGVFSLDLVTRAASFETALIAAFAPFYNHALYAAYGS